MSIERNGKGDYSWTISPEEATDDSGPEELSRDSFERRLDRLADDVTRYRAHLRKERGWAFDAMDLPAEVVTRAERRSTARYDHVDWWWGCSVVGVEWSRREYRGRCWVNYYKIRLDPIPDGAREVIVRAVAQEAPPPGETRVWFGAMPDDDRVVPHVGIHHVELSPTKFLDFLSDVLKMDL